MSCFWGGGGGGASYVVGNIVYVLVNNGQVRS